MEHEKSHDTVLGLERRKHECMQMQEPKQAKPSPVEVGQRFLAFFYFYIFQNCFLHKYIFGFIIYRFIPLPPGRGAAGPLPGGRDLNVNKIYF